MASPLLAIGSLIIYSWFRHNRLMAKDGSDVGIEALIVS
jgi:hypothetical protein